MGGFARARLALATLALTATACSGIVTLEPPDVEAIERRPPEQSFVYDADGNELAVLRHEFRERVPLARIPARLADAVVAAEDRRFWTHGGVDGRAVARAALRNVAEGEVTEGGSTITQQLAKNLYLPDAPRTFETKFREALLARELEGERTKEQILEDYLNTVYFGNGAYGVQAAAYTYWRKDVADLSLDEAALLAGLIRSPETLSPARDPQAARARRDEVLDKIEEEGLAPTAEVAAARRRPVAVEPRPSVPQAREPYWVDFVVRTLLSDPTFGPDEAARAARLYGGGLRIHTTLRPELQRAAEAAAAAFLPDPSDPEVALVAVVPATGEIVAALGGRDHAVRQFDLATQGLRQPGSTFKTFVLAAAVASGHRPDTLLDGNQGVVRWAGGQWNVHNYDRVSYGTITLADATRDSVNAAYARLALELGIPRVVAAARAMGVESKVGENPAIALGGLEIGVSPLEMAAAYATLANLGSRVPVSPIDRVEDAAGQVVWRPDRTPRRAFDPGVAYVVTQMLVDAVEHGTGGRARLPGWEVAGKTGTVQHHTDAWFVGYTPELSVSVWMGHPDARVPMREVRGERVVTGGSWPARIWRTFAAAALAGMEPRGFVLPADHVIEVDIDPQTGLLAAPWCPGERQALPRILAPRARCPSPPPEPSPEPGPALPPCPPPEEEEGENEGEEGPASPTEPCVEDDPGDGGTSEPGTGTEDAAGEEDPSEG